MTAIIFLRPITLDGYSYREREYARVGDDTAVGLVRDGSARFADDVAHVPGAEIRVLAEGVAPKALREPEVRSAPETSRCGESVAGP